MTSPQTPSGAIAGSVLPIRRAEELIATLQGVLSVRIVPNDHGSIDEIHVLTTNAVLPKQTVRNIESALMAQLGWRVNHRKISIATTLDPDRAADLPVPEPVLPPAQLTAMPGGAAQLLYGQPGGAQAPTPQIGGASQAGQPPHGIHTAFATPPQGVPSQSATPSGGQSSISRGSGRQTPTSSDTTAARRTVLFEDVEVRRSRTRGVLCRVTLSRESTEYFGEAEGQDSERSRIELAARAGVQAILEASRGVGGERALALEGAKLIGAFDREFIFVSVAARIGRDTMVLTGSCEVRDSAETSAVLAILDATNRWMNLDR